MSERTKGFLKGFGLILVGCLMQLWGYADGRRDGREQMKRWQDDWYAAHPNIPGCDPHVGDGCVSMSVEQWKHWNEQICPTPPPPNPQKRSKRKVCDLGIDPALLVKMRDEDFSDPCGLAPNLELHVIYSPPDLPPAGVPAEKPQ